MAYEDPDSAGYGIAVLIVAVIGLMLLANTASSDPLRNPEIGVESTAGPGEAAYSETLDLTPTIDEDYFVLESDLAPDHGLVAGRKLLALFVQRNSPLAMAGLTHGKYAACVKETLKIGTFSQSMKRYLCFQDLNNDLALDSVFYRKVDKPKITPAKYQVRKESRPDPRAERRTMRGELLYQGSGGGVLRLLYREYSNSLARDAFSQELSYDLESTGPTTIFFRGCEIEILEAGNRGIRYIVHNPMNWTK